MALKYDLSSRERILTAMDFKEPDHVPLFFLIKDYGEKYDRRSGFTFGNFYRYDIRKPFSIDNHIKRVEETLKLGIDDTLCLEPPLGWAEEYCVEGVENLEMKARLLKMEATGEELIEKQYITPEGVLKTTVKKTEDWPHGDNIPLFSDYSESRSREFIIKSEQDLKKLKYLLGKPKNADYQVFKQEAQDLKKAAKRLGVVLEGGRTALGDSLVWLLGLQNMIMKEYDEPSLIEELLDILCDWEEKRAEIIINEGIEVLVHAAWYEITDFWTPVKYREMIKPRLARLIKMAHEGGVKFKYIITKSFSELKEDFLDLGIDSIMGVDPVQGNADLKMLKKSFNGKISMWGGINAAVTLGRGTPDEIRKAVAEAIHSCASGGGFVLYPVDNIFSDVNPWNKIEVLLDMWRHTANYPIGLL